jgi:hypothetical protein
LLAEVGRSFLWGACAGLTAMVVGFGLFFTHWAGEEEPLRPVEAALLWPLIPILVLNWWAGGKRILVMVTLQVLGYTLIAAGVRFVYRMLAGPARAVEPENDPEMR